VIVVKRNRSSRQDLLPVNPGASAIQKYVILISAFFRGAQERHIFAEEVFVHD